MKKRMSKLFFVVVAPVRSGANRCGVDIRPSGVAKKRFLAEGCRSAKPYCIMNDRGRCWRRKKKKSPNTVNMFFLHKAKRLFCTLEEFHSLNYGEMGKKSEKKRKKKNRISRNLVPGSCVLHSGCVVITGQRGTPSPPLAPIEDRFKASLYIQLQLIASHHCCQSELSHQTMSGVIKSRIREVRLEWNWMKTINVLHATIMH